MQMLDHRMNGSTRSFSSPFDAPLVNLRGTIGEEEKRPRRRALSRRAIEEICASIRMIAVDDLAKGRLLAPKRYCDACQRVVCSAGFVDYGRYALCNCCAMEYEVASARCVTSSIGRYVRDKNFGETAAYALDTVLSH
jgi:hypothetical protein